MANTNDVEKPLTHVMEDVNTHYEIAYPPTSNNDDGHFRKIEVKLARAGLTVQTRDGYFAVPDTGEGPVTPEEIGGLKALDRQPRPHDFDFLLRPYRYRQSGATTQYAIAFEMPISNLTAIPGAGVKKHLLHASLLALVKDSQGRIVDRSEERRVGKECRSRRPNHHSNKRRHTSCLSDWSSDVCSSDLIPGAGVKKHLLHASLLALVKDSQGRIVD